MHCSLLGGGQERKTKSFWYSDGHIAIAQETVLSLLHLPAAGMIGLCCFGEARTHRQSSRFHNAFCIWCSHSQLRELLLPYVTGGKTEAPEGSDSLWLLFSMLGHGLPHKCQGQQVIYPGHICGPL